MFIDSRRADLMHDLPCEIHHSFWQFIEAFLQLFNRQQIHLFFSFFREFVSKQFQIDWGAFALLPQVFVLIEFFEVGVWKARSAPSDESILENLPKSNAIPWEGRNFKPVLKVRRVRRIFVSTHCNYCVKP